METLDLSSQHTTPQVPMQPIVLEPVLVERIWGTDNLAPWSTQAVTGMPIGEIWLTAESCKVEGGPAAGSTLAEVTASAASALGDPRHQGFPLLIKLLFPREKLSVQVHPNDTQAQVLGMPRGKTECWYVLSAEPGAEVAVGFRERLSADEVKACIQDGTIESKLRMLPVKAGDMVFVDAGTVHAIGPGMVVLETQQYSDTTYRLWDYGRPRELHVDAGSAVSRADTAAGLVAPEPHDGYVRLVSSVYFSVDRFDMQAGDRKDLGDVGHMQILIAMGGGCALTAPGAADLALPQGKAVVLPAGIEGYLLHATAETQVVRVLQP